KYNIPQMVVVADSGLMSKNNIKELIDNKYLFILGARLKQYTKKIKDQILALTLTNGETSVIELEDKQKLIISYSDKRAKKDSHNRELGLERLRKKVKTGKLTKSNINNRGYNKYLKMEGDVSLSIDMDKYEQDAKWDGLKGYITNTQLTNDQVIENYQELWKIEKAFRISKSNLKIRPIYHRLERRIKAHICISFVAYKIFKELERQLDEMKASISVEKAINIAKTIHAIRVKMPNNMIIEKTLILHEDQKELAQLFNFR
ncbi:IS1634 family transposase, partial [Flammeovirga aprica]